MKQSLPYFAPFSNFPFVYFCHLVVHPTSFPGFSPISRSMGRVGENPGNEVVVHLKVQFYFSCIFCACLLHINLFNASLAKSVLEFVY